MTGNEDPWGGLESTVAMFPGQGSQRPGMGRTLTRNYAEADEVFDECSDALGLDVRELAWDSSPEQLGKTENTQVALVAASIAAWRVWTQVGGNLAHAVAGHSIGALSAAIAGGYIPLADGIKLARRRGHLMASAPGQGSMLAVAVRGEDQRHGLITSAATFGLDVAAVNGERQVVLSGPVDDIEDARKHFGAKSSQLNVSHAFHSRLMEPVMAEWQELLSRAPFRAGDIPMLGCTSPGRLDTAMEVSNELYFGIRQTVRWDQVLEAADSFGTWVYLGTAKSLSRLRRNQTQTVQIVEDTYVGRRT
ncbi:[acyl-carrier-protein] S-malonyltransferase [Pseudarthrobacter sp. PvP004]|uniref:ACP S-malonyltransferase n=1 Tax=Pseudarthrobacter sp. PvP004 TaxID=2817850 RepID=UPI001AE30147|nr:ACP S-malonyltransferase [Pseudarthrobacter sp. PvP004]MBP2265555.1 [acyl-carrier-protein] S-malonyltransferase [Pseudarthrobacter sp. PvP004]